MSEPILEVTDLVKRFPIKGGIFGKVVATVDAGMTPPAGVRM